MWPNILYISFFFFFVFFLFVLLYNGQDSAASDRRYDCSIKLSLKVFFHHNQIVLQWQPCKTSSSVNMLTSIRKDTRSQLSICRIVSKKIQSPSQLRLAQAKVISLGETPWSVELSPDSFASCREVEFFYQIPVNANK